MIDFSYIYPFSCCRYFCDTRKFWEARVIDWLIRLTRLCTHKIQCRLSIFRINYSVTLTLTNKVYRIHDVWLRTIIKWDHVRVIDENNTIRGFWWLKWQSVIIWLWIFTISIKLISFSSKEAAGATLSPIFIKILNCGFYVFKFC